MPSFEMMKKLSLNPRVSCKGPTAAYLGSKKHDRSNALSHRLDLRDILKSNKFKDYTHYNRGLKKLFLLRSDN